MRIPYSIEVDCTQRHLWSFLVDPKLLPLWMKGLESIEQTDAGRESVGSTAILKIREGGKLAEYQSRLTAFEPHEHIALVMTGKTMPSVEMHVDYRLVDLVDRTRLDYLCRVECKGFFIRLMMVLFGGFARMQLAGFMKTLKRLAEDPSR